MRNRDDDEEIDEGTGDRERAVDEVLLARPRNRKSWIISFRFPSCCGTVCCHVCSRGPELKAKQEADE